MGIARSITKLPGILVFVIITVCVALSVFGMDIWIVGNIKQGRDWIVTNFDKFIPQISIRGGKASIKEKQPYFIHLPGVPAGEAEILIDTRQEQATEALEFLKQAKTGFVLTRDSFVIKNERQIRIIPLKGMPDVDLNSGTIRQLFDRYFPMFRIGMAIALFIWYFIAKLIQILLLALIPLIWTGRTSKKLGYGGCMKVAAVALVPLTLLELALNLGNVHIPGGFKLHWVVYFGLYILFMIIASVEAAHSSQEEVQRPAIE